MSHAGHMETTLVDLPEGYDSTMALPLLVVLHGRGGTAEALLAYCRAFRVRDVILAAPEGQYLSQSGGTTGYSWYLETTERRKWAEADRRSVEGVQAAIREVCSRHKVKGVVVFGFSQGASLAYMVGLTSPSTIGGIVAVGGSLPEIDREGALLSAYHIARATHVRIFIARGIHDANVTRGEYVRQANFLAAYGYDVFAHQYDGGHHLTGELFNTIFAWMRE